MNQQTNKQKEQTDTGQTGLTRWEGLEGGAGGVLRGVNGQFPVGCGAQLGQWAQ